jgi:DHA2 family multidrug resistance protein
MATNQPKPLTKSALVLAAIAVSLATFLIVLDYSIANVSIPYISGDLASSIDQGTYVITSFAIGTAIILPTCGWLTKRLGMIRLIVLSLAGFTLFSLICGLSQNLSMLVIARFLQGALAGPLIPLSQSIIVRIFPEQKRNAALSFWSTIVVIAPVVGPILGGWICYNYTWPWIFYINIPTGLFCIAVIHALLKDFETPVEKTKIDTIGFCLLAIGTSALQFTLDKGQQYDWLGSQLIQFTVTVAVLGFVFLLLWEMQKEEPLIELKLLKIRSYTLSLIFIAVSYAIYFGSVVLIPLWLQEYMGYTPVWAGLVVAPIGIIPSLFSTAVGNWVKKVSPLILLGICFVLFALSSFSTAYFNTDVDVWHITLSRFLLGAAILFFLVPLFALSMQDLPAEKQPSALGLFHYVRAMVGAVGTSVFTTLWIRRSAFYHSNLAASFQMQPGWTDNWSLTNQFIDQQASVLALNDCFYLMGWIFLGLVGVLFFARKKKGEEKREAVVLHGE